MQFFPSPEAANYNSLAEELIVGQPVKMKKRIRPENTSIQRDEKTAIE